MNRKNLSVAGALLLTAAFLALALRNVRFESLWGVLSSALWRWIPAMAAVSLLDLAVRALRWRILLSRAAEPPSFLLFRLEAIGLSVNNVLFMRLGELARAFLASRELGIPLATALSSVAVERALDVAALLTLFCAASASYPALVPGRLRHAALLVLAGVIAALFLLAMAEAPLEPGGLWERRLRRFPKLHDLVSQLAAGAAILRDARAAGQVALLSLVLWGADAWLYWAGARALGLGWAVDYPRSILVLSWAGAGAALPAAPGAFGTFEAMVKSILVGFGASADQALGYAVFNHMVMYVTVTGLGLVFLCRVGLSLGELRAAIEKERRPRQK